MFVIALGKQRRRSGVGSGAKPSRPPELRAKPQNIDLAAVPQSTGITAVWQSFKSPQLTADTRGLNPNRLGSQGCQPNPPNKTVRHHLNSERVVEVRQRRLSSRCKLNYARPNRNTKFRNKRTLARAWLIAVTGGIGRGGRGPAAP